MITITRLLAKQVASVFPKALGLSRNLALDQPVRLTAGPDGLFIRSCTARYAVEYRVPTAGPPLEVIVPLELFRAAAGAKPEPVAITTADDGAIVARWQDAAIPKAVQWIPPDAARVQPFPADPTTFAENPPGLRTALQDAFDTTDSYSTRYSLGCVQLQGEKGAVVATDGHQLLVQSGFRFSFTDEVLVERSVVFAASGLSPDAPVQIGKTDHQIAVRLGAWTFYLPIYKDGKFPRVEDHIPATEPTSTLEFHQADREFLAANLPKLPANPGEYGVTVDLNGSIVIRSRSLSDLKPTELILSNSRRGGDDVAVATDRRFLARAVAMGFTQLAMFGDRPLIGCRDERRTYLWMSLAPESIAKPHDDAVRIESPPGDTLPPPAGKTRGRPSSPPSPSTTMPENPSSTPPSPAASGQAPKPRRSAAKASQNSPIEQAVNLRSSFRGLVTQTNELIRSLKGQKRQQRLVQTTLKSLKDLQAA